MICHGGRTRRSTMARKGRTPLATGHVEGLSGSELAKRRLTMILKTLSSELTIAEACTELGISESRFHALRHQWLEEALKLLEPRPMGRPSKASPAVDADELAKLQAEKEELQRQLHVAQVREEIAAVLPQGITTLAQAPKKTTKPPSCRRSRDRRQRRRPR